MWRNQWTLDARTVKEVLYVTDLEKNESMTSKMKTQNPKFLYNLHLAANLFLAA